MNSTNPQEERHEQTDKTCTWELFARNAAHALLPGSAIGELELAIHGCMVMSWLL